jgi:hypothetical protein
MESSRDERCSSCCVCKPLDRFSQNSHSSDGKCSSCKDCFHLRYLVKRQFRLAAAKQWAEEHPAQYKKNQRAYYERNRDALRARSTASYAADREKGKRVRREYARAHPKEAYVRGKAWRKNNLTHSRLYKRNRLESNLAKRHKQNEANRKYAHTHPWVIRRGNLNRQARLRLASAGHYTLQEWERLLNRCDHRCLGCGTPESETPERLLEKDHVIPLSIISKAPFGPLTKGLAGLDLIDNVQPLCKRCNRWKWARTIDYR